MSDDESRREVEADNRIGKEPVEIQAMAPITDPAAHFEQRNN